MLARRAKHSLEMLCWIRLQVEIPVTLSGIFVLGVNHGLLCVLFMLYTFHTEKKNASQ